MVRILASLIILLTAVPVFAQQNGAQSVIDGQIKAFRTGAHEQAFGYASPNLQRMFRSTDNFIAMVKRGYGPIYGAQTWTFGRSREENGTLYQELLLTGPQGKGWSALYSMRQEADGKWRIHGVQMQRAQLQTS